MQRFYRYGDRGPAEDVGDNRLVVIPGVDGDFSNFTEYLHCRLAVWNIVEVLRQKDPNRIYGVRLHIASLGTQSGAVFYTPQSLRQWALDPGNYGPSTYPWKVLFSPQDAEPVKVEVVSIPPAYDPGAPLFRASRPSRPGAVRGHLGKYLSNCVMRQMVERVTYHLADGSRRAYMWTEDEQKRGIASGSPGYCPLAMKKLSMDATYRKIKMGCEEYLHKKGLAVEQDFGFEPRDLCYLAELTQSRIMVFVTSSRHRTCRWDTEDLVQPPPHTDRGSRFVFCFNMTSDQHLEMLEPETMSDGSGSRPDRPGKLANIQYWDDGDFEKALYYEGSKPEDERRLYLVKRRGNPSRFVPPVDGCDSPYASTVLQCGDTFYKHLCLKDWTECLVTRREVSPAVAAVAVCEYDVHACDLISLLVERNVYPVKQSRQPGLFNAIRHADKQFGHVQAPMDEGDIMYEYDGRKWYLTNFSEVADFPYFHGIPVSNTWNEYKACGDTVGYEPSRGFVSSSVMIGNAPGDEPFTFGRDKYAIFQIEHMDLSGCSRDVQQHLMRDGLFIDFDPEYSYMFLPSPVVHLLQDLGAVWRASRLWVCYGCWGSWIPDDKEGNELRREMEEAKTYPMALGCLMRGRHPILEQVYVAPDQQTATSLQYWYSRQFAHGRLAGDRDDPDVVYEGEEAEHEGEHTVRPDTDPYDMMYNVEGEFIGTSEASNAAVFNGYVQRSRREDANTFTVTTYQSTYGHGSTYAHISGAQHAYCFVQLYRAVVRLPPSEIVGFSLDAIRTRSDVTACLGGLVSSEFAAGTFKPAQVKRYKAAYRRDGPMLSELYTPKRVCRGISAPDPSAPAWNSYKDSLGRISIVTGKAGSGKTTRHFQLHSPGRQDYRLPGSAIYVTFTNHLAAEIRAKMGVMAWTSFKGFNRKVDDTAPSVRDRFSAHAPPQQKAKHGNTLYGAHSVLMDEVSMIPAEKIRDAIQVCREHHVQLLITGDFDRDQFYQLGPVFQERETFFDVLREVESSMGMQLTWVEPMRVFRQLGDPEFQAFLDTLRELRGRDAWNALYTSELFEHISYDDMLEQLDPAKDLVAHNWHRIIAELTHDAFEIFGDDQTVRIRGNFSAPYKPKEGRDSDLLQRLKIRDTDELVYKGGTGLATKAEIEALVGTRNMNDGLYSPTESQHINPLVGSTVFNLQGLTMPADGTLYILSTQGNFADWISEEQPRLAYVAASRARHRDRLVIVDRARHSAKRQRV